MDNLTHSLVGALLGQTGLKRKSGLAMQTLIIAANIPDIDAGCTLLGMVSLAMRRGITHGPIAMLVLPLALTAIMVWYDRWQDKRGTRPAERLPVRPGWLLALAFVGCLSHPFFDWLNSYGVRLLEPFSHRWFYGDALFIVDPWLLAMLIAGVWLARRRDKAGRADWQRPAWAAFAGVVGYIGLNLAITANAVAATRTVFATPGLYRDQPGPTAVIVANIPPVTFWRRHILWRDRGLFGDGAYDATSGKAVFIEKDRHHCADRECAEPSFYIASGETNIEPWLVEHAQSHPEARAFLFWSRMPIASPSAGGFLLRDQRFLNTPTAGNFEVELKP